jgi:hypothetical protein
MDLGRKRSLRRPVFVAAAGISGVLLLIWAINRPPITLKGAVIRQDADINKEQPIAGVEIIAANGLSPRSCKSDSSGFFSLALAKGIRRRHPIILLFRQPEYQPLDLHELVSDKIYVVRMVPTPSPIQADPDHPEVLVANVRVRYTIKVTTATNIGTAVKTFQVANRGNVPCDGRPPCSPDGKWKAAVDSVSLDAGQENEFRNARASCIAGPCPFTKIEVDAFSRGGRKISVSARNWSDTAAFLLEAEVFHSMVSNSVRVSYPVIFGQALNFTLPPEAEGVSMEADISGTPIVFPLGPTLSLSWAKCNARVNPDRTRVYRCELNPGYRFR